MQRAQFSGTCLSLGPASVHEAEVPLWGGGEEEREREREKKRTAANRVYATYS